MSMRFKRGITAFLWRWTLRATGAVVVVAGVVAIDLWRTWATHRPAIARLVHDHPTTTAYMARRTAAGMPPRRLRWVAIDSLPAALSCTVLASENVRFFRHGTLDWTNQRDLFDRLLAGDLSRGGSGIAQQLARNLFLSPDRTPRRKLREYLLAYQVSHALSKERQLELYLNLVEWGDGVWGIAAASEHWFGRGPDRLTPSEAVLLATVLPAPSRGLAFPLSPSRRSKLAGVTTILWRELVIDDLTASATLARLRRAGEFVDRGKEPSAALASVAAEMGLEPSLDPAPPSPAMPLKALCDPTRRGVT